MNNLKTYILYVVMPDEASGEVFDHALQSHGLETVVMGCTELPIAIQKYADPEATAGLTLIDPATEVARMLTNKI
ncbi:MAG: hypothetical protein AAB909_01145 [Patescibacteria group bacterium]